jgi:transcription elongation factor GreA
MLLAYNRFMRVPTRKAEKYINHSIDPCITQGKFEELTKKLEKLITVSRPREAEEVKRLALMGDFSENAGYQIAKGRLRGINQRILEIENILKKAEIINTKKSTSLIEVGHTVTLEINGKEKEYLILGSLETNPGQGIISHNSPLGLALLGKKIGTEISLNINGKPQKYKILKIA